MTIIPNYTKQKLEAGKLVVAFNVVHWRGVSIGKIAKAHGFDWLFIDNEHNTMDADMTSQTCVAALDAGVTPIVRAAGHEGFHATRALDGGAMGIVVPHVNSVEEARQVVHNCKFPPIGHRSLTAPAPQLGFAAMPIAEAIKVLNDNTLVTVMLETPHAIDQADAIAAVEGVDVLMIGANDLLAEMGLPGQYGHEKLAAAFETMCAATKKHGKHAGLGGVYDHALMEKFIGMGVRWVLGGSDIAFMTAAAKSRADFLHSIPLD